MSQEIEIKLSKTARIVFCLLTLISIFMLWTFYYFDNNDERGVAQLDEILAESPQEAIDLKQKEFFLKHQNTEIGSFSNTSKNSEANNDSISYCNKICPSYYIMSVDCDYCFMFGQWRSDNGQKELLIGKSLKMLNKLNGI